MQKSLLVISMLSSWAISVVYYQINRATGMEPKILLCAAIAVMVFGLYAGLHTKNKRDAKEEA